jgi:DNA repair protein RecO (recombination protein O)
VPASIETEAIVLRSVNYGEADRIVTLAGRDTGKVTALARNARKSARRFAGLGLGVQGRAVMRERRGADLWALESFEAVGVELAADVATTAHMAYALELCDRLCPLQQVDQPVYTWLRAFLEALAGGPPSAARLRTFELGLLARVGLGVGLDACLSCGRVDADPVRLDPRAGGLVCGICGGRGTLLPPAAVDWLRVVARAGLDQPVETNRETGLRCREALQEVIELHAGGPLRSVTFIAKLSGG